ncbi:AraC family transcriptional regulator [Phenylobacterium sp. LjRoot225]|uniref:AraC family transcriptional regulator n=1 Tax=Phenylobacterium sp. LjRoot225 TaxID=3342285 RepID=UPI003ECEA09D
MAADPCFLAVNSANGQPSLRRVSVASPSPADALRSVTRAFFRHEVVVRDESDRLNFNHSCASLGDVSLNQIAYGADVDVRIEDLQRSHFVLVIALSGSGSVEFNQRRWDLQGGDCVLMSPNVRYRFELGSDHTHLAIGVPHGRLSGGGRPFEAVHNIFERREHGRPRGGADLVAFIEYLCGELHEGSPIFGLSAVIAANETCFLQMLRAALFEDDGPGGVPTVLPGFVRRADRYISAHLKEDISLDDIVAAAGVPARTLYHGFQRFLGESPMRWLRLRRLECARADLIASGGDISVIDLANQYWIGHCGRFARMYRELYGETPSQTLARVPGDSDPASRPTSPRDVNGGFYMR